MNPASPDTIHIRGLELPVRIGVPEEEREAWQVLTADIELTPQRGFDVMTDEIASTVDYQAVALAVKALASKQPRKLLEVLAAVMVSHLLEHFAVESVSVELRKRILPGVDHVAVKMARGRS